MTFRQNTSPRVLIKIGLMVQNSNFSMNHEDELQFHLLISLVGNDALHCYNLQEVERKKKLINLIYNYIKKSKIMTF